MECLFCKIVSGEVPAQKVYEDDSMLAFRDISPMAPTHILVIPKLHLNSAADITTEHAAAIGAIFAKIADIAKAEGLSSGFRVVTNSGKDAGQSVEHLHFHIIGGRSLSLAFG